MSVIYKICGCGVGYRPQTDEHSCVISRSYKRSAQLLEKPTVWENPTTGEKRFLHTDYMEKHYTSQGFEKREFNSYFEHKKWCDDNGYVNHAVEGIKDEALKG